MKFTPSGAEGGCGALELCAQHLSSKPSTVSKVHASAASPSQSRAGAEHSFLSGLSLGFLLQPGAALLITRLHPARCHITTVPENLNSVPICCPMQCSFPYDEINGQCAAYVDCLSPLSIVQTMCVCTREWSALSSEAAQAILSKQVCSTAKGLHHFQMRDGTESSPLYKLMVYMVVHLWS